MTRNHITFAAAALAASLTLIGCNSQAERDAAANASEAQNQAKAPVELPPSIQASRTYRCRDNSLVYVDFYTNNTARVRIEQNGTPTILTAEGGNPPFRAEGYSVSANAENAEIAVPGRGSQSCRAGNG